MNLPYWADLPEAEQRRLAVEWYTIGKWGEYEQLAIDAAGNLHKEMESVPEVTCVETTHGGIIYVDKSIINVRELVLNVCTFLPGGVPLENLPSRFQGFGICQTNLGDRRLDFLNTWMRLFKEIRGWNDDTTLRWAEKWTDGLKGRGRCVLYHYGPVKIAVPSLIDEAAQQAVGDRLQKLYGEMTQIIEQGSGESGRVEHPDTVENYDWGYVRERLSRLIVSYMGGPPASKGESV